MKRIISIGLILIMSVMLFTACGDEYDFVQVGDDKESLDIQLDNTDQGYTWKTTIGQLDKLVLKSEKNRNGKYIAKIGTITKSGKGKKGGRAAVAFTYVNNKNPNDIKRGYVVGVGINPKGRASIRTIDEYKVNMETTVNEE